MIFFSWTLGNCLSKICKMSKFMFIRTEEEVGILRRISEIPRFKGIFKGRYSDFHVNEIDLDGNIVHLTSLDPPFERKSDIDENDAEIVSWIPEDVRNTLKELQQKLEEALKKNTFKTDPVWKEKIYIKVTNLGKEERTKIHKWLGNFDKLCSETVDKDDEKCIVAVYDNKNNRNRRRPSTRAKYTHCTMYKEGMDTTDAIGLISKKLRIKPNFITFCGTKDKHGKTTQRICFKNIDANRIVEIARELRSVKLGNYAYLPNHLRLGDLKGNHFQILLREVEAVSDETIASSIESLQSSGFINYFGMQRFGSYEVSTHAVGKKLLQNKWIEAFDLILKPKGNDSKFMKEAKHAWFANRNARSAADKFPRWHQSIESTVLHGLAKFYSKNDFVGVFLRIPRNVRHLYIHSFQSYLWNQVASYRIEKMGLKPCAGDLVYVNRYQDDIFTEETDEESDSIDEPVSKAPDQPANPVRQTCEVKSLTEEDLPNYSIFDVLIPIHGTQITIPPESHIRTFYDELLKKEELDQDVFFKFKPVCDQPKGAYRKLIVKPANMSYKIIPYNDSDLLDSFIPSEADKLNEKKKNTESRGGNVKNGASVKSTEETKDLPKDKKCVIVEFSLPSSSYATMALREILVSESETKSNSGSISMQLEKTENENTRGESEPDAKRIKVDTENN